MLDIDITLLIQMANFLALMVILNLILYRPLRKIIAERKEKVSGLEREIEGLIKNASQRLEDFKVKMGGAHERGNKEKEILKNEGLGEEKQIISKTRSEAEASKSHMLSQVEQDADKAKEELKGQVSGFASDIAAKILGRSI
ncbi:MAG: ATP synthase F0 subunit B [Thermodesulfobacteriota bacterium]|nr:ATP synthase F0 subunit B [Thermodesulfobacteriota bacterium]